MREELFLGGIGLGQGETVMAPIIVSPPTSPWHAALATGVVGTAMGLIVNEVTRLRKKRKR